MFARRGANRLKKQSAQLTLTPLEQRDVPALWQVAMTSPPEGVLGDTASSHSGSLNVGSASVSAANAADAIRLAVGGTETVYYLGQTQAYSFPGTGSGSGSAFRVTVTESAAVIELEDLAGLPQFNPDWDYNDHYWYLSVTEQGSGSGTGSSSGSGSSTNTGGSGTGSGSGGSTGSGSGTNTGQGSGTGSGSGGSTGSGTNTGGGSGSGSGGSTGSGSGTNTGSGSGSGGGSSTGSGSGTNTGNGSGSGSGSNTGSGSGTQTGTGSGSGSGGSTGSGSSTNTGGGSGSGSGGSSGSGSDTGSTGGESGSGSGSGGSSGSGSPVGVIGDYVWLDANGDGFQDEGEHGIAGVTVELWLVGAITFVRSTVTGDDGHYQLPVTDYNDYQVRFVNPDPLSFDFSPWHSGNVGVNDSDVAYGALQEGGYPAWLYGFTGVFSASPIITVDTIDAGLVLKTGATAGQGTVTGRVWQDWDKDGIRDAGEAGVSGDEVKLYQISGNSITSCDTTSGL